MSVAFDPGDEIPAGLYCEKCGGRRYYHERVDGPGLCHVCRLRADNERLTRELEAEHRVHATTQLARDSAIARASLLRERVDELEDELAAAQEDGALIRQAIKLADVQPEVTEALTDIHEERLAQPEAGEGE